MTKNAAVQLMTRLHEGSLTVSPTEATDSFPQSRNGTPETTQCGIVIMSLSRPPRSQASPDMFPRPERARRSRTLVSASETRPKAFTKKYIQRSRYQATLNLPVGQEQLTAILHETRPRRRYLPQRSLRPNLHHRHLPPNLHHQLLPPKARRDRYGILRLLAGRSLSPNNYQCAPRRSHNRKRR
jgi:hypothetical protein